MPRYTALIDGEAGAYGVVFPDLPGCTAMGNTIDEAITNAVEALHDWAEVTIETGNAIPAPRAIEKLRADPAVVEALAEGASLTTVPLIRETGKPTKANISIDAAILAAIDAAAGRRKLTRSAFIELMARHSLPELSV